MRVKPNGLSFVYSVSGIYVMMMDLTPMVSLTSSPTCLLISKVWEVTSSLLML